MSEKRASGSSESGRPHADVAGEDGIGGGERGPQHECAAEREPEQPDPEQRDHADGQGHDDAQQQHDGAPRGQPQLAVDLKPGRVEGDHHRRLGDVLEHRDVAFRVEPLDAEQVDRRCREEAERGVDHRARPPAILLVGSRGDAARDDQTEGGEAERRRLAPAEAGPRRQDAQGAVPDSPVTSSDWTAFTPSTCSASRTNRPSASSSATSPRRVMTPALAAISTPMAGLAPKRRSVTRATSASSSSPSSWAAGLGGEAHRRTGRGCVAGLGRRGGRRRGRERGVRRGNDDRRARPVAAGAPADHVDDAAGDDDDAGDGHQAGAAGGRDRVDVGRLDELARELPHGEAHDEARDPRTRMGEEVLAAGDGDAGLDGHAATVPAGAGNQSSRWTAQPTRATASTPRKMLMQASTRARSTSRR